MKGICSQPLLESTPLNLPSRSAEEQEMRPVLIRIGTWAAYDVVTFFSLGWATYLGTDTSHYSHRGAVRGFPLAHLLFWIRDLACGAKLSARPPMNGLRPKMQCGEVWMHWCSPTETVFWLAPYGRVAGFIRRRKPGKVLEFVNCYFQAWKSSGKKSPKSFGKLLTICYIYMFIYAEF